MAKAKSKEPCAAWVAPKAERVLEANKDSFDRSWRAVTVKVMARTPELAPLQATEGSAGYDLFADLKEPVSLSVGGAPIAIQTGVRLEIPKGYEAQVRGRSSLAARGVIVPNSPGTIDSDFRGEVKVLLVALSFGCVIRPGDRIAQLVFARIPETVLVAADSLSPSSRGTGGFGSTGA